MKAVVFKGPYAVELAERPDPKIEEATDAIIRITTTNICGSDLHMYEGRAEVDEGMVLGHENMGIVEETGPAVGRIKRGDRVSVPFNIGCGTCKNCVDGFPNYCLRTNPTEGIDGAAYGYSQMGPYHGGQASFSAFRTRTSTSSSFRRATSTRPTSRCSRTSSRRATRLRARGRASGSHRRGLRRRPRRVARRAQRLPARSSASLRGRQGARPARARREDRRRADRLLERRSDGVAAMLQGLTAGVIGNAVFTAHQLAAAMTEHEEDPKSWEEAPSAA